jgi:hypothetical protein
MASNGKKRTTMAKLNRESKLREKRADKQARKDARKRASAEDVTEDVTEVVTDDPAAPAETATATTAEPDGLG